MYLSYFDVIRDLVMLVFTPAAISTVKEESWSE